MKSRYNECLRKASLNPLLREWDDVCNYVKRGAKKTNKDLSKIPLVRKEGC